jgi:hypothetical protein
MVCCRCYAAHGDGRCGAASSQQGPSGTQHEARAPQRQAASSAAAAGILNLPFSALYNIIENNRILKIVFFLADNQNQKDLKKVF